MTGPAPVSVVIPTHRRAELVLATIDSVLAQRTPPREVIVVDDGSPDDTAERLAPLVRDGRIRYLRQANAGLSAARNAGAATATGDHLLFLDDDDLLLPGALEWMVAEMERHPDAGMVYGECVLFTDAPPPAAAEPAPPSRPADHTSFLIWNRLYSAGQALIRRSAFEAVGGFDTSIWGTADWDMWLSLLERFEVRASAYPVLAYRVHGSMSSNVARMYENSLRVARRHLARTPPRGQPVLRHLAYTHLRSWHAPRIAQMARGAVARREWRQAAAAGRAWIVAWMADVGARAALKAHLVRHGHWRLSADERLGVDEAMLRRWQSGW